MKKFKASDLERSLEKTFMKMMENQGVKFVDVTLKPPVCSCGKEMLPVIDPITKKVTGHLWSCDCPKGEWLSIG